MNAKSPADYGWIHELAKTERNPDLSSPLEALSQIDPRQLIEETTLDLLDDIKMLFTDYIRSFNGHSENGMKYSEAKIYGITNTAADFMIFRNNVKLVFANTAQGIVNISLSQHLRDEVAVDGTSKTDSSRLSTNSKDLIAQMGPFMEVQWTFQGEKINIEQLTKFYFIEFAKASRMQKKESSNQILLKQIKTLLQEKGINL